jgi:hypothetical protein
MDSRPIAPEDSVDHLRVIPKARAVAARTEITSRPANLALLFPAESATASLDFFAAVVLRLEPVECAIKERL